MVKQLRRAVGIVRVSVVGGREGDSFASPGEQRDRITAAAKRERLRLLEVIEELDVSGGKPLGEREGLRRAVEMIEAGDAEVVIVAYFDRLVRSLSVQHEVVERVENAGGQVFTVDIGQVSHGSAGQWLSGTMLGAVNEYFRRAAGERSREAVQRAINRGVVPWKNQTHGYRVGDDGRLVVEPGEAGVVREAFERRAAGGTYREVREFLRGRGIDRSYHGVQALLASRVVLGEIHFGDYLPNLEAHEAIVDRGLWQRVQDTRVSRGRRPVSDRLLARLGVLRCGSCGARMIVGHQRQNGRDYPFYRCPPVGDCTARVAISARIVEEVVVGVVREALADDEGRASAAADSRDADVVAERAQEELDAAIRAFTGLEGEAAAVQRLRELRDARDGAVVHAGQLRGAVSAKVVSGADWDRLTVMERRALIRALVREVRVVKGGVGAGRVRVEFFSE